MPSQTNQPLPADYVVGEYRIERLLSSGGFSIVYLARDAQDQPVAIKEYLPAQLALRSDGDKIEVISEENRNIFRHGLKCFFEEGRALANIAHPNVVRVTNFFRANETCYMVMQYVRGRTLHFHIQRNRLEFTERFLRRLFLHLLNGLREVHANKLLHLDIKPANIYIAMDGRPLLLDFGAARQQLNTEKTRLKPMYTAGFAAPEQYEGLDHLGPWTDIYAIGASMYCAVAGFNPQPADKRVAEDKLPALFTYSRQMFSKEFCEIVDWCMTLDYLKRPQTAFELQKALRDTGQEQPAHAPSVLETLRDTLTRKMSLK